MIKENLIVFTLSVADVQIIVLTLSVATAPLIVNVYTKRRYTPQKETYTFPPIFEHRK